MSTWTESGTASLVVLRPMLTYARAHGVDVDAILGEMGVTAAMLDDYDHRVPEAQRAPTREVVASEQSRDPLFGMHVARPKHHGRSVFDVLDYALASAMDTLGEAFDHIVRYHRVLCDAWAVVREDGPDLVRVRRVEDDSAAGGRGALRLLRAPWSRAHRGCPSAARGQVRPRGAARPLAARSILPLPRPVRLQRHRALARHELADASRTHGQPGPRACARALHERSARATPHGRLLRPSACARRSRERCGRVGRLSSRPREISTRRHARSRGGSAITGPPTR